VYVSSFTNCNIVLSIIIVSLVALVRSKIYCNKGLLQRHCLVLAPSAYILQKQSSGDIGTRSKLLRRAAT